MYTPPPSSLGFDYRLILEWGALISVIIFALYAVLAIKNEVKHYEEEAAWVDFGKISLLIPKWWKALDRKNNIMSFQREDTYYDWKAIFMLGGFENMSSEEFVSFKLEDLKIELDNSYESFCATDRAEYLFRNENFLKNIGDCYRCEGVGFLNNEKRIYLDIFAFKLKNDKQIYCGYSLSSVLNGCVEGPYFEEVIKHLKLTSV